LLTGLTHILYHLKENQVNIRGILAVDADGLFMGCFKQYLAQLFRRYTAIFPREIPEALLLHHLTGSFAETVKWWMVQGMTPEPETAAHYYCIVIKQENT